MIVRRIIRIYRGFQTIAMECIWTAIAAEELARTATGTAILVIFLRYFVN